MNAMWVLYTKTFYALHQTPPNHHRKHGLRCDYMHTCFVYLTFKWTSMADIESIFLDFCNSLQTKSKNCLDEQFPFFCKPLSWFLHEGLYSCWDNVGTTMNKIVLHLWMHLAPFMSTQTFHVLKWILVHLICSFIRALHH